MRERHGVAVARHHGDDQATLGHRANKADRAAGSGAELLARGSADIDAAMLSARVRVRTEAERSKYRPARGPRPRVGSCWHCE